METINDIIKELEKKSKDINFEKDYEYIKLFEDEDKNINFFKNIDKARRSAYHAANLLYYEFKGKILTKGTKWYQYNYNKQEWICSKSMIVDYLQNEFPFLIKQLIELYIENHEYFKISEIKIKTKALQNLREKLLRGVYNKSILREARIIFQDEDDTKINLSKFSRRR